MRSASAAVYSVSSSSFCEYSELSLPSFQGARSTTEFWADNAWLGGSLVVMMLLGGALSAGRAFLYKLAYDAVK